ncbi:GNAT family N-acetyltransferase [Paenibacillus sp. 19GGS1-52]|uniref:GNAT family N-acetyltransferase n=1 Tax=Paenibacillus sp. 19GGS1-52 TaxID=2758563 RepID=UPI001EFBFCFB|nr:GNAT family N-acetyltransferase [Paenibacillus sp. 19GGS1-52]ULO08545.1 GNAT family N-acetyltransferase [Paenibacillus sp. 19GGS1-52]
MIIKMTISNIKDYNKSNESFTVIGRIIPKYEDGIWSYTEELFSEQYYKQYDKEDIDISCIDDENKAVYLYYFDNNCIGQIKLRAHWNGYAFIEDISVAKKMRGKSIGTALLNKAAEWAKQNKLMGLVLETQDVNLLACRFYAKNNFIIGAVDTMMYSNFPTANEIAIYWYKKIC